MQRSTGYGLQVVASLFGHGKRIHVYALRCMPACRAIPPKAVYVVYRGADGNDRIFEIPFEGGQDIFDGGFYGYGSPDTLTVGNKQYKLNGSDMGGGSPQQNSIGGNCTDDVDCLSYSCSNGKCSPCTSDDQCPNDWACGAGSCKCNPLGGSCSGAVACCSATTTGTAVCKTGSASSGTCSFCQSDADCPSGQSCSAGGTCELSGPQPCTTIGCDQPDQSCNGETGACDIITQCSGTVSCGSGQLCMNNECVAVQGCQTDSDCSGGQACIGGTCVLPISASCDAQNCPDPNKCLNNECFTTQICQNDADCSEGQACTFGTCATPISAACGVQTCPSPGQCVGETCVQAIGCASSADCGVSESCLSGICIAATPGDQPVIIPHPVITLDGTLTSSASFTGPAEILHKIERQAAFPIIFTLFNVSKLKTESTSKCIRGAVCSSSKDCCGGDCIGSFCACSVAACVDSGDCCTGYCYKGDCRLPPNPSLFFGTALSNQQIGCAGLIDECSQGEKNCISICNGLSFLLMLVAGGFGAYAWKLFKHPIPGLVAAFTPVVIGLTTYPFIGIILGVVLFSLLISKN